MFRKRRFMDQQPVDPAAPGTSVLAEGAHFEGVLRTPGDALVGGTVLGSLEIAGRLRLTASGRVDGGIQAKEARVEGTVMGPVTVEGFLEVDRTARIEGDLSAEKVAIAEGAVLLGALRVSTEPTRFQEKRRDDPYAAQAVTAHAGREES